MTTLPQPPPGPAPVAALPGDLACWLAAAFPRRRDGRLDTTRAAEVLGVSRPTVRRWARSTTLGTDVLTTDQLRTLHRRAHLRGQGRRYLWPAIDQARRDREARTATEARAALAMLAERPDEAAALWGPRRWLEEHEVIIARVDAARVWQVFATRAVDATSHYDYLARQGGESATITVANRHAATLLSLAVLAAVDAHRCIVPSDLIRGGRSYCWRIDGPRIDRRRLARIRDRTL